MLVGVVSNTDGRADAMEAAVAALRQAGAEWILHCGDVGGRHVLDILASADSAFIWGDRDRDRMGLLRHAQKLDLPCYGVLGDFELDGKRLVMVHGDDDKVLRKLLDEQQYDYILCGHTTTSEDRKVGKTRLISPGSLHGAAQRTALLIDPAVDAVKVIGV